MINKYKFSQIYSRKNIKTNCYYDRISEDMSNKVFFIYDLGKYNNKNLFYYGETLDIIQTEFLLKKTLPMYKNIYYSPIDTNTDAYNIFSEYIKDNKAKLPLKSCSSWDIFYSSDIGNIISDIDKIFDKSYLNKN